MACLVWAGSAQAVTKTSAGSGNWGANGTWSPAGVPAAGDDVVIASPHVVTLNVNTNNLRTVTINAGGTLRGDNTNKTLNVTGNTGGNDFTNNGTLDFGPGSLATYFLANSNRWAGAGAWTLSVLDHSNRTLTFATGSSMTLNISGATVPFPGTGTITSLNTVVWNFTGSTAQTLSTDGGTRYGTVRITNTSPAGVTLGIALTAARLLGDLTVETGATLNNGGFAITLASGNNFAVQSGAFFTIAGGTMVTVSGGGTKTFDAASTVTYSSAANQAVSAETYGHLVLDGGGNKTPAAGTHVIAGDFTIKAGPTYNANANDPTINVTGNVTIDGTYNASNDAGQPLTISGSLSIGGTYTGRAAPLNLAGNFTLTGAYSSGAGVVTFNGASAAAQTITGAPTFTNLTISNTGAPGGVALNSDMTVGTQLTLTSGTLAVGANTLTLNGPTIAGTPSNLSTTSSSSLVFGGTSSGVSVPGSVTQLNNLTLNNANGITLSGSPTVNGTLTFTSGDLLTGSNKLTIGAAGSITGPTTARHVVGNLEKVFAAATAFTYPIGDGTNYMPVAITFGSAVTGNLTATTPSAAGDHPDTTSVISSVNAARSVNRYWTLKNSTVSGIYTAVFNYPASSVDGGVVAANLVVAQGLNCAGSGASRSCAAGWVRRTTTGSSTTQATATGLSMASGAAETDFVIGEPATARFFREKEFVYTRELY